MKEREKNDRIVERTMAEEARSVSLFIWEEST